MFERNEVLTELVEALFVACQKFERGDVFGRDEIATILGVAPHERHWDHCVIRLKQMMEEKREIALWAEKGLGYRLLTKDEQLTMLPLERMRRAKRQVRRARLSVEAMSDRSLTAHQRRTKIAQLEALRNGQGELIAQSRRQAILAREIDRRPVPKQQAVEEVAEQAAV